MSIDYSDIEILDLIESSGTSILSKDYSSLTGTYLDLISSNLIYEFSSEHIRKAIGGYFYIRPDEDYNKSVFVGHILAVDEEDDIRGLDMTYVNPLSNKISKIEVNPSRIFTIDGSVALPNVKIPFRMYANSENVLGDVYWREYIKGGEYGGDNFNSLHDVENIYYDIAITIKTPVDYKILRACEYLDYDISDDKSIFEVKSYYKDYNKYVQNYQDWSSNLESELLIPNYNIIVDKFISLSSVIDATAEDLSAISRSYRIGQTDAYDSVMEYNVVPGVDMLAAEKDRYYGSFFVNHQHSAELKQDVIRNQQNIIFSSEYFKNYYGSSDFTDDFGIDVSSDPSISEIIDSAGLKLEKHASTFYNAQINFTRHKRSDTDETGPGKPSLETLTSYSGLLDMGGGALEFADSIFQPKLRNGHTFLTSTTTLPGAETKNIEALSAKLLEILKDIDEGTITEVPVRTQSCGYANNFMSVVTENGLPSQIKTAGDLPFDTIGIKTINFMQLLTYIYNNYDVAINDNYIFMGPQKPEYASTIAKDTLYKNKITQDVLLCIDNVVTILEGYINDTFFDLGDDRTAPKLQKVIFKNLLSPAKKYYEVMAYKIEKFGGTPTGDSSTQNVIQKFWVYNDSEAPNVINITDSQVKYGETYTYRISAYAIVLTHKYKYADYRLTKQIATGQKFDEEDLTEEPKFCLQFYNPANNERTSQIFTTTTPEITDGPLADYAISAFADASDFAVDQIDISTYPQLADFHLYFEPCVELMEIPIAEKTINILDSPPNAINVTPFHFIDNSDRIGFKIGQDSFIKRPYPEIVTDADILLKGQYLRSRELVSYQNIIEPSESPARYIEMYRTDKRPNAFTDFRNDLVSTIDLRVENSEYNYLDYIAADQIIPNKKYYYVFRLLNENKMPGPLSQIIEAQLTNDGGYVYSTFDTIDSSEFNPNKIETKTKNAKKIFQLEPHLHQMILNSANADFTNTASEEVDNIQVGIAEQSIWDNKRFKIRLTSTKTGRKLDLNTGFNLRIKDLISGAEDEVPTPDPEDETPIVTDTPEEDPIDVDTPDEIIDETPEVEIDEEEPIVATTPPPEAGEMWDGPQAVSGYGLYLSQVHFISYGGAGQPSAWDKIVELRASMSIGPGDEGYLTQLFGMLGEWFWTNREIPADPLDETMFYYNVSMIFVDSSERADWVARYFEEYPSAPRPLDLGYLLESEVGELSIGYIIQEALIAGSSTAGAPW